VVRPAQLSSFTWLSQTMGMGKSLFLGLLIVSVVGLKLTSGADSNP
jgi:multidrug transporter EmrE-like cation transporter